MDKIDIYDLTYEELQNKLHENKFQKFRAQQIWNFLYIQLVNDFKTMHTLPKELITYLDDNFILKSLEINLIQKSSDGTQKALLTLIDNENIETVLMKYKHGYTVCVTTQIGCKIGCSFCASHRGGFIRNLSASEIVRQVIFWNKILKEKNSHVSNIVVMGIGEPLDNLENVLKFIDIINDSKGINIGARKITVSTSGIVPKIYEIAKYKKQINLAISIHAPNNILRSRIMKINDVYKIEELMLAIDAYQNTTNRQVTFEYLMLNNINDTEKNAKELSILINDRKIHVNLIPYNIIKESDYNTSKLEKMEKFQKILFLNGISSSIRAQKGNDIDGACGQLRNKKG